MVRKMTLSFEKTLNSVTIRLSSIRIRDRISGTFGYPDKIFVDGSDERIKDIRDRLSGLFLIINRSSNHPDISGYPFYFFIPSSYPTDI